MTVKIKNVDGNRPFKFICRRRVCGDQCTREAGHKEGQCRFPVSKRKPSWKDISARMKAGINRQCVVCGRYAKRVRVNMSDTKAVICKKRCEGIFNDIVERVSKK